MSGGCQFCETENDLAEYPNGYGGVVLLCKACRVAEEIEVPEICLNRDG